MSVALESALATAWLWQLALGCLLALALLWWMVRGAQRWRRRRSLRQALDLAGPDDTAALERTFDEVCNALLQAQPGTGRVALYARPWVLFLAEPGSRVSDLLQAASPDAPVHGQLPQTFWRWHLLPHLVAIEIDPALVETATATNAPAEAGDVAARWYRAILLLAERRSALPLDGIVLCVDAQALLQGEAGTEALAARLRRRAEEISTHLHLRLPTQILVTGIDRLSGFEPVRTLLPQPLRQQAVGIRVPPGRLLVIDDVLDDMARRMRALRMGLLRQEADAGRQLAVHRFFDAGLSMQASLSTLLKRLFAPGRSAYRMRGRGLYFVAAPPAGDETSPAFLGDLFERFLPAERAFVRLRR